jgi:hypothetical protein
MHPEIRRHLPAHQVMKLSSNHVGDSLHCMIVIYGETHIDNLAQLLSLQSYAETEFSWYCCEGLGH